jgi:hypothetical protein
MSFAHCSMGFVQALEPPHKFTFHFTIFSLETAGAGNAQKKPTIKVNVRIMAIDFFCIANLLCSPYTG